MLSLSVFGLFLGVSFLTGLFIVWRLSQSYELDSEVNTNLAILVFVGGLIGARILYILSDLGSFNSLEKILIITKYPGLSLWGGLIGGGLIFWWMGRSWKLNLPQLADFGVVALIFGLILGDLGCTLSGCQYGINSTLPIALSVPGVLGKRFPVSLVELILFVFLFRKLWRRVVRFHLSGIIAAVGLIWLGIIKLLTEPFRADSRLLFNTVNQGYLLSFLLILVGLGVFYSQSKRTLRGDLYDLWLVITTQKRRNLYLLSAKKSWYNRLVNLKLRLSKINLSKMTSGQTNRLYRRLNVKPTPKNYL